MTDKEDKTKVKPNDPRKRVVKRADDEPKEEFIEKDPNEARSEAGADMGKIDSMGISEKAKNQPSDEGDTRKEKK